MLCEKCKREEATVHVTEVVAEAPDEMKKHNFCEACFSQTEFAKKVNSKTAGWASYGEGATAVIFPPTMSRAAKNHFTHTARVSADVSSMRALLFAIIISVSAAINSSASTLTTPSYKITVEVRCPEGSVTCDDVRYVGVSRKSGKFIKLTGRTVHTTGADGVTPSHFLGYEFNSGRTIYFVGEDGELRIARGSRILIQETGVWKW